MWTMYDIEHELGIGFFVTWKSANGRFRTNFILNGDYAFWLVFYKEWQK